MKSASEDNRNNAIPLHDTVDCETAVNELKKIYWYEKQLLIAIPMLLQSASTSELTASLTALSKYTKAHISSLEAVFPGIERM